jgi:hypothetical protein
MGKSASCPIYDIRLHAAKRSPKAVSHFLRSDGSGGTPYAEGCSGDKTLAPLRLTGLVYGIESSTLAHRLLTEKANRA